MEKASDSTRRITIPILALSIRNSEVMFTVKLLVPVSTIAALCDVRITVTVFVIVFVFALKYSKVYFECQGAIHLVCGFSKESFFPETFTLSDQDALVYAFPDSPL